MRTAAVMNTLRREVRRGLRFASDFIDAKANIVNEGTTKIAKGNPQNVSTSDVTVHVPITAQVVSVRAQMRNVPWPDGPDWGTAWVEARLDTYHEPMGWCRAEDAGRGTTPTGTKWFKVRFFNWSHVKPREGRAQVTYTMDRSLIETGGTKELIDAKKQNNDVEGVAAEASTAALPKLV